jgi:fatty-acyl-CoA synthase
MAFVITNHLCDLMPGTTAEDASLVVAPLSHGAGVHQLTQVARGAATVLLDTDRFDAEAAWALIEKWRITNIFTVPTILKLLVEHPSVDCYDHSSLRHVVYAGAPMYRADEKVAFAKLGPVLVQYFGLGEVTGNITCFHRTITALTTAKEPGLAPADSSAPPCRFAFGRLKATRLQRDKPERYA